MERKTFRANDKEKTEYTVKKHSLLISKGGGRYKE